MYVLTHRLKTVEDSAVQTSRTSSFLYLGAERSLGVYLRLTLGDGGGVEAVLVQ